MDICNNGPEDGWRHEVEKAGEVVLKRLGLVELEMDETRTEEEGGYVCVGRSVGPRACARTEF